MIMIYLNIPELLEKKGKTMYWLVKKIESSYQALGHMINGETTSIHFETIEKLCDALECDPGDLIKKK